MSKRISEIAEQILAPVQLSKFDMLDIKQKRPRIYDRFVRCKTLQEQLILMDETGKFYIDISDNDNIKRSGTDGLDWSYYFDDFKSTFKQIVKAGFEKLVSHADEEGIKCLEEELANRLFPLHDKVVEFSEFGGITVDAAKEARYAVQKRKREIENDAVIAEYRARAYEQLSTIVDRLGQLMQPSPESIEWNGSAVQLAYLLHALREAGLLGTTDIWAWAERSFTRNGEPVRRTTLKALASKYGFREDGKPAEAEQIDSILEDLFSVLPRSTSGQ